MTLRQTLIPVPIAWRQLSEQPIRFAVALLGVTFAVVLVLMQLGFSDALYASAVSLHRHLDADLVLISPQYSYLAISKPFSRRRLQQARALTGAASAAALSFDLAPLKNPETRRTRNILVLAVDARENSVLIPGLDDLLYRTRLPDSVLFDESSRPEYGVKLADIRSVEGVFVELGRRRVHLNGSYTMGTSFAVDGNTIVSRETFLRLFPHRRPGMIDMGLIRLRPGADVEASRTRLAAALPPDVEVLTREGFVEREQAYWRRNTPIGYVFTFGVVMGLVVGAVIVYLVLFVNVAERLPELATLKAIGFSDHALFAVVLQQAGILAVAGFLPGALLCRGLYVLAARATHLPLVMTAATSLTVLALTLLMCSAAGGIALRKVRDADPAEVFA